MAFTNEQITELSAKLDRANVKEREQAGRKFSYIEAYHAENEANRIFGYGEWDRFTDLTLISETITGDKHRVYYRAKVRIVVRAGDTTVTREGCGYGSGIDKDLGQAHESALKEAESDAEKRALKTFGNPFGQALYDKTQSDVQDAPKEPKTDLALVAAQTAIQMCNTKAELRDWKANNASLFGPQSPLSDETQTAIVRAFNARVEAVKPVAVANG